MADHDRTEEATPRKLRRARERGEVPQSRLATGALSLIAVTGALVLTMPAAIAAWRGFAVRIFAGGLAPERALAAAGELAMTALAWPLAAAVVIGALGSALQVGPLFTVKPLAPDLRRIDLARGLTRTFSLDELAPRLGGLALAAVVFALAGWVLARSVPALAGRPDLGARGALEAASTVVSALVWRASALLAAAGVIGIVYRRARHLREQRMSRRELRQEQRETEGEPLAKRRRVEAHRERALGASAEEALTGAVIVVRGDGAAVVVRWRRDSDEPAEVSLVARGALSSRVIALASRAGVPSVHDASLARELARSGDRGLARPALIRLARHLARLERTS